MNSNDLVDRHEVAINSLEFERQVRELRRVTVLGWVAVLFVGGDPLCRGGHTGLGPSNPNEEGCLGRVSINHTESLHFKKHTLGLLGLANSKR